MFPSRLPARARGSTRSEPAAERVKTLAGECGFDLVRIGPASDLEIERSRYLNWIEEGRSGEMRWIDRAWAERSASPAASLVGARSVISLGISYGSAFRPASDKQTGRIARYAWMEDYHTILGRKLERLVERLQAEFGGGHRWYVDTGPQMDKALAARSGLGWYGKNSNILTEKFGSFVLLAEVVTTLELAADAPLNKTCGSCRLCVVACPTGALDSEYSIDSRKCISYLTIEHRGPIPRELRPLMGNWVFGCDICQDVCPPSVEPYLQDEDQRRAWLTEVRTYVKGEVDLDPGPEGSQDLRGESVSAAGGRSKVDLTWLLRLSHEDYLEAFRGSSIRRAKVWMLRRNAAVALGNVGDARVAEELGAAMSQDEHPIVRGHAAWALGRIANRFGLAAVKEELCGQLETETDGLVREEIVQALNDVRI